MELSTPGPRLVTRAQAAEILGYSRSSLSTLMRRHPERWPAPSGHRPTSTGRGRVLLYDLDALTAACGLGRQPGHLGAAATVSDEDGLIVCLDCPPAPGGGAPRFRSLGPHLHRRHGTTAIEYRERHGLPATAALTADSSRAAGQQAGYARRDADQIGHLEEYQGPDRLEAMRSPGDASAGSRAHPAVRRNRRPGQEHAVTQMVAARIAKLDETAQAHGYADAADAVEQTLDLSARAAARATGLSPQTITRRRSERA